MWDDNVFIELMVVTPFQNGYIYQIVLLSILNMHNFNLSIIPQQIWRKKEASIYRDVGRLRGVLKEWQNAHWQARLRSCCHPDTRAGLYLYLESCRHSEGSPLRSCGRREEQRHHQYCSPAGKSQRNKHPCLSVCPLFGLCCCPSTKPNRKLKIQGAQVKQCCRKGIQRKKEERTENRIEAQRAEPARYPGCGCGNSLPILRIRASET